MPIEELDLGVRAYNCLKRAGINCVAELTSCSREEAMKIRAIGCKSFEEVEQKLALLGLSFRSDEPSQSSVMNTTIEEMDLSVRAYHCLKRAGINCVGDLLQRTIEDMMEFAIWGASA